MQKQTAAAVTALAVLLAALEVTAQYGPPPTKGKKHRTTTTTTEAPGAHDNEITGPIPIPSAGLSSPDSTPYSPGSSPYAPGSSPYAPGSSPYGPGPVPFGPGSTPQGPGAGVPGSGTYAFSSSSSSSSPNLPGSTVVTGGSYWWQGNNSPFKPGTSSSSCGPAGCGQGPAPGPSGCGGSAPGGCGPVPPSPPPPPAGGCGGPAGCTGVGTDPRPSPAEPPSKPIDIAQNPFLSSAILGKPISSGSGPVPEQHYPNQPSGQHPGQPSGQYPGQPSGQPSGQYPGQISTQYPGQPSGQPTGQYPSAPSAQYPGQPTGQPSGQYPGQPSQKPTGQYPGAPSAQYPGRPTGQPSGQYPGPTQKPGQFPGQPSSQYPGQPSGQYPGQPSSQYPSQPTGQPSSQYPGQPSQKPSGQYPGQPSGQYPGQPTGQPSGQYPGQPSGQYPGQPTGQPYGQPSSQYPGQSVGPTVAGPGAPVPLRPKCTSPGTACVPSSSCVGGVITALGMRQMRDPQITECIPGLEACCKIPSGSFPTSGVTPTPGYGVTQKPYSGPLNTTPYPGCAAALKCVAVSYCTAEGVMSNSPVILTREQAENRVPLTDCQDLDTGIIGKCCRDPNYKDPWPAGMMMKSPGDFDDGQYHGEGSGPTVNVGPSYNSISSTPQTPSKDHGPKPSDRPGGFNKPFPPPFPGNTPSSPSYTPGKPQPSPYQPGKPTGSPYQPAGSPNQPGGSPYQPGQPTGSPYQPGQPTGSPYQPGQPAGSPYQPGQPAGSPYQPGQPGQPGRTPNQPSPTGNYQPGKPSGTPYQPSPTGTSYQPSQPTPTGAYQPGQPTPTGTYQPGQSTPTGSYQPSQPPPTGTYTPSQPTPSFPSQGPNFPSQGPDFPSQGPDFPSQGPDFPGPETQFPEQVPGFSLPTHPGQHQPSGDSSTPQGPAPGSSCGIRRPGPSGDVAGFAEFPWQALVTAAGNRSLLCGAAIISDNAVITAAHCVSQIQSKDLLVKAGEWKLLGQNPRPVQVRPVAAIARHPGFDSATLAKDLAIVMLTQPLIFDVHVDKICIPPNLGSEYFQKPGQSCLLTGWGKNALQGPIQNSDLHKIEVNVIPAKQCEDKLKNTQNLGKYFILNEGFSCAIPPTPTDLCKVDYGSAVACDRGDGHYELAGVNSWDIACPTKQPLPTVFATSDAEWINTVLSTPLPVLQAQEGSYEQSLLQGEDVSGVDIDDKPGFNQGYGK